MSPYRLNGEGTRWGLVHGHERPAAGKRDTSSARMLTACRSGLRPRSEEGSHIHSSAPSRGTPEPAGSREEGPGGGPDLSQSRPCRDSRASTARSPLPQPTENGTFERHSLTTRPPTSNAAPPDGQDFTERPAAGLHAACSRDYSPAERPARCPTPWRRGLPGAQVPGRRVVLPRSSRTRLPTAFSPGPDGARSVRHQRSEVLFPAPDRHGWRSAVGYARVLSLCPAHP